MTSLRFTTDELLRDHQYAAPHVVAGRRMHGGFLADGIYQPPRAAVRQPAIEAWTDALRAQGGELYDADASLLGGPRMPTVGQSKVLLAHGLGETFWNTLTITGKIEAKGRLLAEIAFPDLQEFVVDDISEMALGHLHSGLLLAHGLDEGGTPEVGGHDEMWFAARDLAFGVGAYPDVDPPDNIARPEAGTRFMPEVSAGLEGLLSLLMNLLIIEFRAEIGFATSQELLRTPSLFPDRVAEAAEAAEIIDRIRTDELIHVTSLRLYLGELATVGIRTTDGGTIPGRTLIDRFWGGLVQWATVDQPRLVADQQRALLEARIARHPDAALVMQQFSAAA